MPFTNLVATLALRVWAGGDARLAAAALNNASDDDLEAAGLTCRDVRLSGTAQDSAEGIAGAVARALGLEPADLEPANVARLRTDMDGVDALAIDRDARLFGGDELLVSGPEAPPVLLSLRLQILCCAGAAYAGVNRCRVATALKALAAHARSSRRLPP